MAHSGRAFRVFVSSTFSDLKVERNALQERVFPRLRGLCQQHGCRFQVVDLRWGVSEEAALDQQTMRICLGEIERCQAVSPRPNFIVLLGNRYGWRPLPYEIPEAEFDLLAAQLSGEERALLDAWYRRDENAIPPTYLLRPRTGEFIDFERWETVENTIRQLFLAAIDKLPLSADALAKYTASATEQEIIDGALRVPQAHEHVFGYFRTIENLPDGNPAAGFIDLDPDGNVDPDAAARLTELKRRLANHLSDHTHEYVSEWVQGSPTYPHLDQLCQDVYADLEKVILSEVSLLDELDPLEEEIAGHRAFGEDRARAFTGRAEVLASIAEYLSTENRQPLVVWGRSGCGKSAVLARAAELAGENHPEAEVMVRFTGTSHNSSTGRALLESLCRQIYRQYDLEAEKARRLEAIQANTVEQHRILADSIESAYKIHQDLDGLSRAFPRFLASARPEKPLFIFLDALDQLSEAGQAGFLSWLPVELPPNTHLVVSILPGEGLEDLEGRLPAGQRIEVAPMPVEEGEPLLDLWLSQVQRRLQPAQKEAVLSKFRQNGLPLYLKLAFEEARNWGSFDPPQDFSPDTPGMIRALFHRLSAQHNHGEVLVSRSLAYLGAARYGLTEDELIDVLSRDAEVIADFRRRSPRSPHVERLPYVVWSRLYFELEPYLVERTQDGSALMSFYHRQLRTIVEDDIIALQRDRIHDHLAAYYSTIPTWHGDFDSIERTFSLRKVMEYPWQLLQVKNWEQLDVLLCDLTFVEAKCALGLAADLIEDYRTTLAAMPETQAERLREQEDRKHLERYQADLIRFNRGWNRIRFGGGSPPGHNPAGDWAASLEVPVHRRPGKDRSISGATPAANPFLERIRAFAQFVQLQAAHLGAAADFPLFVIQQAHNSASSGPVAEAARAWLAQTPHRAPLFLADPPLYQYVPYPDRLLSVEDAYIGQMRIAAGAGRVVCATEKGYSIWDLPSGRCVQRHPFTDTYSYLDMGISADASRAYFARDELVEIWDLGHAAILHTFVIPGKHTKKYLSPDGAILLTGDDAGSLFLWDTANGRCLKKFNAGASAIWSAALSSDSGTLVSGYKDRQVHVWDVDSGKCRYTLKGHSGPIEQVAISADGSLLASGDQEGMIKIWSLAKGRCLQSIQAHRTSIYSGYSFDLSADGKLLISAGNDRLHIWDVESGQCLRSLICPETSTVRVTCDGCCTVTARPGAFTVWDVEKGASRHPETKNRHNAQIVHVTMDEETGRILTVGGDGQGIVWDGQTVRPVLNIPEMKGHRADFSRDGKSIYSAHLKGLGTGWFKIYDANTGREIISLSNEVWGDGFAYSLDGRVFRYGGQTIDLNDLKNHLPETPGTTEASKRNPSHHLSEDGSRLAVQRDDVVEIVDPRNGICLRRIFLRQPRGYTSGHHLYLNPNGSLLLALASAEGCLTYTVYDTEDGSLRNTIVLTARSTGKPHFLKDGRTFWMVVDDTFQQWNADQTGCLRTIQGQPSGQTVFSPDERYLISSTEIWDLELGCRVALKWNAYEAADPRIPYALFATRGDMIYAGERGGVVQCYRITHLEHRIPTVIPVRLWRPGKHQGDGKWDPHLTVLCEWCLKRFPFDDRPFGLSQGNPSLTCPHCQGALLIGPYRIDHLNDPYALYRTPGKEGLKKSEEAYARAAEQYNRREYETAFGLLKEAEKWFRARASHDNLAIILQSEARILFRKEEYNQARAVCREACWLFDKTGNKKALADGLGLYESICEAEGDNKEAGLAKALRDQIYP